MKELQVRDNKELGMTSLSPQEVLGQIKQIQELMNSAMKEGEHYGKIPGTDKPTLLKAGAEKLGFMFRLSPQFEIERVENLNNGHREYIVKCKLVHIPTNTVWGEGVGSCSTMESKYRWRKKKTDTGQPIPKDYKSNKGHYKEQGYVAGKDSDGKWRWYKTEKVENADIADTYNTVLKMAKKRAHVDAMLTATAASDIFTQDVEEIVENIQQHEDEIQEAEVVEETKPEPKKTDNNLITEKQRKRLFAIAKSKNLSEEKIKAIINSHGYESTKDITKNDYEVIIKEIEEYKDEEQAELEF